MNEALEHMRTAYMFAATSPDVSTQNGAKLVSWNGQIAYGHNSIPGRILPSEERLASKDRYDWIVHAEHASILNSASQGIPTFGATMYVPWFACIKCAVSIIQSDIALVVGHTDYVAYAAGVNPKWNQSVEEGIDALWEAGVAIDWIEGPIPYAPPVLVGGTIFNPSLEI